MGAGCFACLLFGSFFDVVCHRHIGSSSPGSFQRRKKTVAHTCSKLFVCLLTAVFHDAFSCTLENLCFLFLSTSCSNMSCAWCPVRSTHLSLPWVLYFSFKHCLRFTLWSLFPGSFPFGWGGLALDTFSFSLHI